MAIIAKASSSNFTPAPSGVWSAVCVDVVDLGMLKVNFGGKEKQQHKIRIVWQIEEDNPETRKPFLLMKRYTLSLHEKAALRQDLEAWRGRPFSETELAGFDVENVIGVPCMLQVMQESKDGSTYANVKSIMQLRRGMPAIQVRDYVRVCDRRDEPGGPQYDQQGDSEPPPFGPDDDVPF